MTPQAQGDADFATQKKNAVPERRSRPRSELKLQTDALLDRLIFQLEPK